MTRVIAVTVCACSQNPREASFSDSVCEACGVSGVPGAVAVVVLKIPDDVTDEKIQEVRARFERAIGIVASVKAPRPH